MILRELIGRKCLCGTVDPWLTKALEEDIPMWVYGVGTAPGF